MKVNIVILSKDRACQLDLLLRSMVKFIEDIDNFSVKILYRYTSAEYKAGYDLIKKEHNKHFKYRIEIIPFKSEFISSQEPESDCTMHLTDDDVFIKELSTTDREYSRFVASDDIICLSYRHSTNLTRNYETGVMKQPDMVDNAWNWRGCDSDYGYPMGYAHLYKTKDILPLYTNGVYDKAWNMECWLKDNPINKNKMLCYDDARLMNIPMNITQEGYKNWAGNVPLDWLNKKYISGERLDLKSIIAQHDRTSIYQDRVGVVWQ